MAAQDETSSEGGKENFAKSLPYKTFKQRHPSYNSDRWAVLRALYEGGEKTDTDTAEGRAMVRKLLPQHVGEENDVYAKRLEFALYIPYAGQICDFIISALSSDPVTMTADPPCDDWYHKFYDDTSAPGGKKQPFEDLLRQQMLTALICRRSWLLVDLPNVFDRESQESVTLAEQERAGALDAYLCPVEPENVIDWEETDDGLLKFAIVYRKVQVRNGLTGNRNNVREEFTYFTAKQWARYSIEWDKTQKTEPNDEDLVFIDDEGDHTFGRVPLVPLELSAGLHAMGKVKQLAQSHFNKRSALDWGEYRSAFQFLAAKLGPEDPMQSVTSDPNRAVNQRIGHGRVMVLGEKDSIDYVGPDAAPFQVIMADLNLLRDEMHRVLHHMALSVDNSAAALQRSGASKAQDQAATTIVLKRMGAILRDYAEQVYALVSVAHGDGDKYDWSAAGLEEFEAMSVHEFLEEVATLNEINIPSQTWKRLYMYKAAKLSLGGTADDESLMDIEQELKDNITAESFMPLMPLDGMDDGTGALALAAKPAKAPKAKRAKPPTAKPAKAPKAKPAASSNAS